MSTITELGSNKRRVDSYSESDRYDRYDRYDKYDDYVENTIRNELLKMGTWNNNRRLQYISKRKVIKKFGNQNIYSNGVYLLDNFVIAKRLHQNMSGYVFWKNEINALKRVLGNDHFPQLIAAEPNSLIIYMTYCGNTMENIAKSPPNWREQVGLIKKTLLGKQLNPNDILPRNVCLLNGKIKLIDFGLSNVRYSEIIKSVNKLHQLMEKYS